MNLINSWLNHTMQIELKFLHAQEHCTSSLIQKYLQGIFFLHRVYNVWILLKVR